MKDILGIFPFTRHALRLTILSSYYSLLTSHGSKMSIIADTLKRLQAQADDSPSKPKENVIQRPTFNKGEGSGRHRKDSPYTFLLVTVGMTITLGGFAAAAFWIGGHLDFGLGNTTQARLNDHRSFPRSLDISEESIFDEQSTETQVAVALDPPRNQQTSTPLGKNNEEHASEHFKKTALPSSTPHIETAPSLLQVEKDGPSSKDATEPITAADQITFSDPIEQLSEDQETSRAFSASDSEEPLSIVTSPELSTELIPDPATDFVVFNKKDEGTASNLVVLLSEEEIIETGEFVTTSNSATDSAPETTLTTLQAQRTSMSQAGQPIEPLQPSPSNRLHHAQDMIRAGEYEDAASLLAPLFQSPPVKWQPWFWMGTALLGKGDMEEADQFFLSGLARNDKIPQLWIQRALVAQQRGDFQLAIHELRQAESLAADLPHIHLNMGYAYEQLGNDQMANQYYGKFLKLSEDQPSFFSTRKKLFARLTQPTAAEKTPSAAPPSSEH